MAIKIILIVVFVALMIGVGLMSRRRAKTVQDFVMGGRRIGPWMSAFSYGTAYFSAVVFVGYAGQFGWKFGMAATWIGLANAVIGSFMAWMILGRRTRIMTQHLQSATMPDFFGKRYNSKAIRIAASVIVFIFLIPYTASLFNGLSRIFESAFGIDFTICIIAMAVLTAVYVVAGGYLATSLNDFIQGMIMLVGIVAVIAAVLSGQGGFTNAIASLANVSDPAASSQPGVFASFFGADPMGLLWVVILTSLGTWGLPQMAHKFYAIKNERSIKTGAVISTLFALVVSGGCYFLGGFGRLFDSPALYAGGKIVYDAIIPTMIAGLPDILVGIVIIMVLSASMSTMASLVMTSSTTLTLDLLKGNVVKNMDEKRQLRIIRGLIVVFIVISALIATLQYTSAVTFIAQLMGISWGAMSGSFIAPYLYGLYWKRVTRPAVWASFIVGVGLTVSNMFLGYLGSPIAAGAVAMLASLAVVPLVSILTRPSHSIDTDAIFSCYNREVRTKAAAVLEEENR